jgi:hypothetical protein
MTARRIVRLSFAAIVVAVIAAVGAHYAQSSRPAVDRETRLKTWDVTLTTACYVALASDLTPLLRPGELDIAAQSAICNDSAPSIARQHETRPVEVPDGPCDE